MFILLSAFLEQATVHLDMLEAEGWSECRFDGYISWWLCLWCLDPQRVSIDKQEWVNDGLKHLSDSY